MSTALIGSSLPNTRGCHPYCFCAGHVHMRPTWSGFCRWHVCVRLGFWRRDTLEVTLWVPFSGFPSSSPVL